MHRRPKAGKSTFTNKELEALTAEDAGNVLKEAKGVTGKVRARSDGSVSVDWIWRYRFCGKVKEMRLGSWPKLAMPEIRERQLKAVYLLTDGKDPAAERMAKKLEAKAEQVEAIAKERTRIDAIEASAARMTVADLFSKWASLVLSSRKDGGAEVRRTFEKDVLPSLGKLAAEDMNRQTIAACLDKVVCRGARIVARNLLGDIRQMYGFAIRRGLLENDPTSHMKRDDYGKKVERERVLSEAEIRAMPAKIETARMFPTSSAALWIMLATCCRIGELTQAKWTDVDMETGTWRIPPENSKNGKEHIIDLSDFAIRHFMIIHAFTAHAGEWVMPAKHNDGPVCSKSLAKQIGDRQREGVPMKNRSPLVDSLKLPNGKWTPHDLRRTGATMMVALGVLPEVVERCLNHVEANRVKRIYQRHDYQAEMRQAWRVLGKRLDLLTSGNTDNVLVIQRRA